MHVVQDKDRKLKFEGIKLAHSSSYSRGRTRWVEFELYRTAGGQYVLSRVGISLYYHARDCSVVARNKIKPVNINDLPDGLIPCEICSPNTAIDSEFYPETARYWAQVCTTAECIIESLYKYDENDARYLTNVARRLLSDAAMKDDGVSDIFFNEHVD